MPGFLTFDGFEESWVYCPVCEARPEGHWPDGTVKWSGGYVNGIAADRYETAYACRCAAGINLNAIQRYTFFDRASGLHEIEWRVWPLWVVHHRDKGLSPKRKMPTMEAVQKFPLAAARQVSRLFRGELTSQQVEENIACLRGALGASEEMPSVSLDDIIFSKDLWVTYFPGVSRSTPGIGVAVISSCCMLQ